jgi:hypothetical protein
MVNLRLSDPIAFTVSGLFQVPTTLFHFFLQHSDSGRKNNRQKITLPRSHPRSPRRRTQKAKKKILIVRKKKKNNNNNALSFK